MPSANHSEAVQCLRCGYLLRGLHKHVCPECAQQFDGNDSRTVNTGRPMPQWALVLLTTPGYAVYPVAAAGCVLFFWIGRTRCWQTDELLVAIGVWFGVALLSYARQAIRLAVARRYLQPAWRAAAPVRQWIGISSVFGISLVALMFGLPLYVWFAVSKPAFDAIVKQEAEAKGGTSAPPNRAGVYKVVEVRRRSQDVHVIVYIRGWDACGFVYSPKGTPFGRCRRLWGGWYEWHM